MKKGFTLIEVLAVIIIIAVVAVISIPQIISVVETSRKEVKIQSAKRVIDAVSNYYMQSQLSGESDLPLTVTFPTEVLTMSGTNPQSGSVTINTDGTYSINSLVIDDYLCTSSGEVVDCLAPEETVVEVSTTNLDEIILANIGTHTSNMVVNGSSVTKITGLKADKTSIKNWVWYSGQLWQVVELTSAYVKLVAANSVTSIAYGAYSTPVSWSTSWARKWLNEINSSSSEDGIFYNKLSNKDLLLDGSFCLDSPTNVVITSSKVTSFTPIATCTSIATDKVGLLTFEDYVYAKDGTVGGSYGGSFLDEDEYSWTMTPGVSSGTIWSTYSTDPSYIYSSYNYSSGYSHGIRPVIYLSSDVLILDSDDEDYGEAINPYMLEANDILTSGENLNEAQIGSYIYISEENSPSTITTIQATSRIIYAYDKTKVRYRIIGISETGIKVERADVLKGLASNIAISSGTNVHYFYLADTCNTNIGVYTGCTAKNYFQPSGEAAEYNYVDGKNIGYFLNSATNGFLTWLSTGVRSNIVLSNWNLSVFTVGDGYEMSLFNTDTSGIFPRNNSDGVISTYVILPFHGDIFSGNDLNAPYWLTNRAYRDSTEVGYISGNGQAVEVRVCYSYGVRPVFVLSPTITIASGSGTITNPYIINLN